MVAHTFAMPDLSRFSTDGHPAEALRKI